MKEENKKIGYKVFNSDWSCRDFQYEIGKTYELEGELKVCENGFHYCNKLIDCFNYYDFNPKNKVAIIEAIGNIEEEESKCATDKIKIVKEITWLQVLEIVNVGISNTGYQNTGDRNTGYQNTGDGNTGDGNSGYRNSGDWNTGNRNTGNRNTGDWNTGYQNTGDRNTGYQNTGDGNTGEQNIGNRNTGDWNTGDMNIGNWNTGDRNTGYMNTDTPTTIRVFNKECERSAWIEAEKPNFLYFDVVEWILENRMTEEEKNEHPNFEVTNGYLKTLEYKKAFMKSFEKLEHKEKIKQVNQLKKLPNYDDDIFFRISGIDIKGWCEENGIE